MVRLVNNIEVSYDDLGAGEVPIIFIHGFPFDRSSWQPQVEALKNDYRVITYDLRGFGKSSKNAQPFTMSLFADDLLALMDELNIPKAILCGLSMGGYITLNAMSRFPSRFAGLVLADTQCVADTEEGRAKRHDTITHIEANGLTGFAQAFVKNLFLDQGHPWAEKIKNIILTTNPSTVTDALKAMAERSETCSTLPAINVPTLIICGRQDPVTTVEKSEFMHSRIRNSTLAIIENAAHLSNLEQPDAFNGALLNFLKRNFA